MTLARRAQRPVLGRTRLEFLKEISRMTIEPSPDGIDDRTGTLRASSRRTGWIIAVTLAGLVVLMTGGLWWNSLSPENSYRRGRRALAAGDRVTVFREMRRLLD